MCRVWKRVKLCVNFDLLLGLSWFSSTFSSTSFCSVCPRCSQAPSLPPGPMTRVLALAQRCFLCIRLLEWETVHHWCCPAVLQIGFFRHFCLRVKAEKLGVISGSGSRDAGGEQTSLKLTLSYLPSSCSDQVFPFISVSSDC